MRQVAAVFTALLAVSAPALAVAGALTLAGGLGTEIREDRTTESSREFLEVYLLPSYRDPFWDIRLDIKLEWDLDEQEFQSTKWRREGDWLRPLRRLQYRNRGGVWSVGLKVLEYETVGSGNLVNGLSGEAEVDYQLPGLDFRWHGESLAAQALVDRVIDPTVVAAAARWEPGGGVAVTVEGAVDPSAPESFTGTFSNGRPVADSQRRVTAVAGEVDVVVNDGDLLDLSFFANGARLDEERDGAGGGFKLALNFSRYYMSRLSLKGSITSCSSGYIPAYFNEIYPLWRWGVGHPPPAQTLQAGGADRNYHDVQLDFRLGNGFTVQGGYGRFDDDSLKRARLRLSIRESGARGLEALVWSSAGPGEELFDRDVNLYSRVTALYSFLPHLMVRFDYHYSWAFVEASSDLVPLTSFQVGALYTVSL